MRRNRRASVWAMLTMLCCVGIVQHADAQGTPSFCSENQTSVSVIDSALPFSHLRVRWESAFNMAKPNQAEWFWPRTGVNGRPVPERLVDYGELRSHFEVACHDRLSFFVEMPVRWVNPEINDNTSGAGDLNAGLKLMLCQTDWTAITAQFRCYAPTGIGERGLGTDNVVLEPALLVNHRLHEWFTLESEVRYQYPIEDSDFAGEILRYGVGLVAGKQNPMGIWATPVAEFVGWVPLNGQEQFIDETGFLVTQSARGNGTLVGFFGLRAGYCDCFDIYGGYGTRLDGDSWFQNAWRLELRFKF